MSTASEQIWQGEQGMKDTAPSRDEIRAAEVASLVGRVSRFRLTLVPIGAAVITLVVLFDRQVWKLWTLGAVFIGLAPIVIYDLRSLRRPRRAELSVIDPLIAIGLQTVIIWLTGAIESPLLVIYVPVALIAGIAAPHHKARLAIVLAISLLLWLMTIGELFGLLPRSVPSYLDLGPGYYDRATYALTKAGFLNVAIVIASTVGAGINRTINRMLDRAVAARQQAVELLQERNRELVQLSGAIAHELKNPLASVQGLVQLLQRGPDRDERERSRLEVLGREVARMRQTLDEFLNFSRPLGELTVQILDIRRLLDDLTTLHEGIAQAKVIRLELPEGELPTLRADQRKLGQALQNLLQNALDATPPHGRVIWIAEPSGDTVLLGVHDSGPGIPAAVLERVAAGGATTKPGGSGIGLAVARAIAEQHGGALLLENPPGGGCRALLRLPR